jgi:hypothetical protein
MDQKESMKALLEYMDFVTKARLAGELSVEVKVEVKDRLLALLQTHQGPNPFTNNPAADEIWNIFQHVKDLWKDPDEQLEALYYACLGGLDASIAEAKAQANMDEAYNNVEKLWIH